MALYTSSSYGLDTAPPTPVAAPTLREKKTTCIDVDFNLAASESHWVSTNKYRLFYVMGDSGVTESDTEIDSVKFDSSPASGWVTTGDVLAAGTEYCFAIWGYDAYGNKLKSGEMVAETIPSLPTEVYGAHIQGNAVHVPDVDDGYLEIPYGATSLWVDYTKIICLNPHLTYFMLDLHDENGIVRLRIKSTEELTNTPTPQVFNVSSYNLNGGWSVIARIWHYDMFGNRGDHSSTEYFVRPYDSLPPDAANNGTEDSLDVTINIAIGESDEVRYAIFEMGTGGYVKTNFEIGADPTWMTREAWYTEVGKVRVRGLSSWTEYRFMSRAKNARGDVMSGFSLGGMVGKTSDLTKPVITEVHLQGIGFHNPVTNYVWNNSSSLMPSGLASFWVDYLTIVELHPDKCNFQLRCTEAGVDGPWRKIYVDPATTTPAIPEFKEADYPELHSNGATYFWWARLQFYDEANNDKTGGSGIDGQFSRYFTEPFQPQAPSVASGDRSNELKVTPNAHASEHIDIEYSIYEETVNNKYVDADGDFVTDAVWQTIAAWGTVVVGGLKESTSYGFKVRSRSFYAMIYEDATSVFSGWSPTTFLSTPAAMSVTVYTIESKNCYKGNILVYYSVIANRDGLLNPTVTAQFSLNAGVDWQDIVEASGAINGKVIYGLNAFRWHAFKEAPNVEIVDCRIKVIAEAEEE